MNTIEQIKRGHALDKENNMILKTEVPVYWIGIQVIGGLLGVLLFVCGIVIGVQI